MRRPVLSRPDDFDLDARELAKAAARRAGLSLEEWAAAILAEHQSSPPPATRRAGSDLDNLIARMSQSSRSQTKRDYETLMAAIAAETEREAQEQASRTSIALESMASWIEEAEIRLTDSARASADQQDRVAAILSQALSSMKERLDTVERQVASERAAPPRIAFPMDEALKALAPVSQNLAGLRADMSRLAAHLEQAGPALQPAVETIRTELSEVRSGIDALATRADVAALDASLGSLAKDLGQGPTAKDLHTLASSITVLYEQVQTLSAEMGDDLHGRLAGAIDLIRTRIDAIAKAGVDRSVVDFLSSQIVDLRQDLAARAEPQQLGRLSDEIGTLGRQIAELRLHQVNKGDFAALKNSLDDVCSALYVTATAQETSRIPEQLESLGRRIDLLARRPEPAPVDLAPVTAQLALLTERMANLSAGRPDEGGMLSDMMERLSSRIEAAAEREATSHEPLIQRFDRIEQELRQLGERTDTAGLAEQVLRALDEKLKGTAQPAGLEAVERQIAALGERLDKAADLVGGQAKALQDEAAGIAERAARTALIDIRSTLPASADLDTLKHGFVELKALHNRSDRKTQDTLRAVHEALEALVSRLPGQAALACRGEGSHRIRCRRPTASKRPCAGSMRRPCPSSRTPPHLPSMRLPSTRRAGRSRRSSRPHRRAERAAQVSSRFRKPSAAICGQASSRPPDAPPRALRRRRTGSRPRRHRTRHRCRMTGRRRRARMNRPQPPSSSVCAEASTASAARFSSVSPS